MSGNGRKTLTDAFAAPRFARSFAGSFFGRRFAFTARGVFAVCRCVAAILPLASPFFFKLLLSLAFCLAAANDGLVGANNGLVGANDSLAAANNKLPRRKAFVCAFSQKEIRSKGRRKRDRSKKNSRRRFAFQLTRAAEKK
ncbi:hypothetical protein [Alloprevotella tannerae]